MKEFFTVIVEIFYDPIKIGARRFFWSRYAVPNFAFYALSSYACHNTGKLTIESILIIFGPTVTFCFHAMPRMFIMNPFAPTRPVTELQARSQDEAMFFISIFGVFFFFNLVLCSFHMPYIPAISLAVGGILLYIMVLKSVFKYTGRI